MAEAEAQSWAQADNPIFQGELEPDELVKFYQGHHSVGDAGAKWLAAHTPHFTRSQALALLDLVFELGVCVACAVVAVQNPAAIPAAVPVCAHAFEAARTIVSARAHEVHDLPPLQVLPTSGGGLWEDARAARNWAVEAGVTEALVDQVVAGLGSTFAVVAAWRLRRSDPKLALGLILTQTMQTVRLVFRDYTLEDCQAIAEAIVGGLDVQGEVEPTAGLVNYSFDDVIRQAFTGQAHGQVPVWLAGMVVMAGKLLGLSVAASAVSWLVPAFVVQFCKDAKLTVGELLSDLMVSLRDLVERSADAWRDKSLAPLFESRSRHQAVIDAIQLAALNADQIPGKGHGLGLIYSRMAHVDGVRTRVAMAMHGAKTEQDRQAAMRANAVLAARAAKWRQIWFGPSTRVKPFNVGVVGTPGIGKTLLTSAISKGIMLANGFPRDDAATYKKDCRLKWWDDYDPAQHLVMVLDEVGAASKDDVDADTIAGMTAVMGEESYTLPCADVNLINTKQASQIGTVLISNAQDYGVEGKVVAPAAFMRRIQVQLKVEVRAEFKDKAPDGSDASNISAAKLAKAGRADAVWDIQLQRCVVKSNERYQWHTFQTVNNLDDLIIALAGLVRAFNSSSAAYVSRTNQLLNDALDYADVSIIIDWPTGGSSLPAQPCRLAGVPHQRPRRKQAFCEVAATAANGSWASLEGGAESHTNWARAAVVSGLAGFFLPTFWFTFAFVMLSLGSRAASTVREMAEGVPQKKEVAAVVVAAHAVAGAVAGATITLLPMLAQTHVVLGMITLGAAASQAKAQEARRKIMEAAPKLATGLAAVGAAAALWWTTRRGEVGDVTPTAGGDDTSSTYFAFVKSRPRTWLPELK
jgi:hypothetical protein